MPWRECSKMDERLRFVARLLEGEKMAELCREFDISRKTGYKIFTRYKDVGLEGLSDRSRRLYRQANRLPFQVETLILGLKREHPSWGAPKIREKLKRRFSDIRPPAISTVHAVLDRNGLVSHGASNAPRVRSLLRCYPCHRYKTLPMCPERCMPSNQPHIVALAIPHAGDHERSGPAARPGAYIRQLSGSCPLAREQVLMRAFIRSSLLASNIAQPQTKPFEISDNRLAGFTLRVQPSGFEPTTRVSGAIAESSWVT